MDDRADRDPGGSPVDDGGPRPAGHDTIPAPTPCDPLLGALIDERYLVLSLLGEGGMGRVYRARHVLMDKPVALKVLHAELAHLPDMARRFDREVRSSSRLSHPHVITVTDSGRLDDGRHYLAMELLEGETLADRIAREGPLPLIPALGVARQMLRGLAHAHSQGVVHRDLKPENAMLIRRGDGGDFVKVLDFGIARLADGGPGEHQTRAGVVFGTPRYLSPEQALGEEVDARADLYAVGLILWEMLVGAPPFDGGTAMEILSLHLTGEIPRLADHGSFPGGLQQVVDRALAKRPGDRFQEAAEFLAALDTVDPRDPEDRTSPSQVVEALERITSFSLGLAGRRRWLGPLAAALVLTAAVAGIVAVFSGRGRDETEPRPPDEPRDTDTHGDEERELDPARRLLDASRYEEAAAAAREVLREHPASARAHLLLGHARFRSAKRAEAMDAWELALTADSGIMVEAWLSEHLRTALDWEESRAKAAVLLARFGGDEGLAFIAEMSNSAMFQWEKRAAARAALIESDNHERIDWVAGLTADFEQRTGCKERREIIAEMEASGDPGFLPLLEEHRPRTVRKGRGKITTNRCIGPAVLHAIEAIEERLARDAAPPGEGDAP